MATIQGVYVALFGRPADPLGLAYWKGVTNDGANLSAIGDLAQTQEYQDRFVGQSNAQVVNSIFKSLFNRDADVAGLTYWVNGLNSGEFTINDVAIRILDGAQGSDKTTVDLKVEAADLFTAAIDTAAEIIAYDGNGAAAQGRAFLAGVTTELPSDAAVDAAIAAIVVDGGPTTSTTLTTAIEATVGTEGNDVFNGVVSSVAGESTLQLGDTIDGRGGSDTLNVTVSGAVSLPAASIKNVETIAVKNLTGATAHDFANVSGATKIVSNASTVALVANNIQNNVRLGLTDTQVGATATFKDGTFAAGSTIGIDAANSKGTVTVGHAGAAGAATDLTLDVVAQVGKNEVTFANGAQKAGDLKTIVVSGNGSVTLAQAAAEFANVTTVNASANKGGVTLALTGAKDVTVTGGAGNDKFTIANFTDKDTVDGGAGKDTLSISLADALAFTKAASVTNIEVLEVTGDTAAATTINADYFGVSNFIVDGQVGHNLTLTNLANNGTVQFNSDSAAGANVTIDVKGAIAGTNDAITLTTDKDGADLGANALVFKLNGVETVNIASSTEAGAGAFVIDTIQSAQLKSIVITGTGDVSVATVAASPLASIDASAAKGAVSISAVNSSAAVTFKGGEGIDTYVASNKGDTIYGSKGADVITLGTGSDVLKYSAAEQSNAAAKDTVVGFNVNADLISFDAGLQTGTASYLGAAAFSASAGFTQLRMNGADLEVDFDGNGTVDFVVELTAVSAADFGAANFTFA